MHQRPGVASGWAVRLQHGQAGRVSAATRYSLWRASRSGRMAARMQQYQPLSSRSRH